MTLVWQQERWTAAEEILVSPIDRGLLHGFGLFETMLAVDGQIPHWHRHKRRLEAALARFDWVCEIPPLPACLPPGKHRARLTITAGPGGLADPPSKKGLIAFSTAPVAEDSRPWKLGISPWSRNEHSPLAGLKTTSYAENLMALRYARALGYDDLLWRNSMGDLCEATTANVFLVIRGVLVTPSLDSGCLPGIGREIILEQARASGTTVEERRVAMEEAAEAEEIFLTNAVRGRIHCHPFAGSQPQ